MGGRHGRVRFPSTPKDITSVDDLSQNPHNTNRGTERGASLIESSLQRYGFGRPLLADREGRLIAGNHTQQHLRDLGLKKIRVVKTQGDEVIVHQRTDLDLTRDSKAQELSVIDNRVQEVNFALAEDRLRALHRRGAELGPFYTESELLKHIKVGSARATTTTADQTWESRYVVLVECKDEDEQRKILERLMADGLTCRAVMS